MNDPTSTVLVPPYLDDYQPRRFTMADLAAMPSEVPSGSVLYELHHGMLITLPPHTDQHGAAECSLASALKIHIDRTGSGKAGCGGVGVVLGRNPDHVFGADIYFIGDDRLPVRLSDEEYLLTMPHLIAEVRDRNEGLAALGRKARDYLQAGVVVVWVVDPIRHNVVEYRSGVEPRIFGKWDTLAVEDIIPGFRLSIAEVLED